MPLNLPKRCPNCAKKCVKTPAGYWLCDVGAGGCGWSDDPGTIQPDQQATLMVDVRKDKAE